MKVSIMSTKVDSKTFLGYEKLGVTQGIVGLCICITISIVISSLSMLHTWHIYPKLVIVGTLSGQNNFEARQSIRDTWQRLTINTKMEHYFIIGKQTCNLPVEDRVSPFGCEELNIRITQTEELTTNMRRPTVYQELRQHSALFIGFTFVTHHKIVVRRLNVLKELLEKLSSLQVTLVDSSTQEIVVFASFIKSNIASRDTSVFVSKTVEPYVLPKDFEGQIFVEVFEPVHLFKECPVSWTNASGILTFLQLITTQHEKPIPYNSDSCSAVSMTFDIYDVDELKLHIESRNFRQADWNEKMASLQSKLRVESQDKKDILFVDVVDVYRNLSAKLLLFFKWINDNGQSFSYLLKTDDDTFVNLLKVSSQLLRVKHISNKPHQNLWWWGSFREQWAVSNSGKWREDVYRSLTYPPFPCGAAYVLNQDLVTFLATNAATLQTNFQGEDVSIGIWLAGLHTSRHTLLPSLCHVQSDTNYKTHDTTSDNNINYGCTWCDITAKSYTDAGVHWCDARANTLDTARPSKWACDGNCEHDAYSRAQLTVAEMYSTWESFKRCGSLCNCSSPTLWCKVPQPCKG